MQGDLTSIVQTCVMPPGSLHVIHGSKEQLHLTNMAAICLGKKSHFYATSAHNLVMLWHMHVLRLARH
jgi:hypothetical protein